MPSIANTSAPVGSSGIGFNPSPPSFDSPNFTQANRARGRQARTAANTRARLRGQSPPGINARRLSNVRNARAARNPITAPRPSTVGSPAGPIARSFGAIETGAATGGTAAGASIWTATPASAPLATAITAPVVFGGGLAIGNAIYEDVLGPPFGPSRGDYLRRALAQRNGPAVPYVGAGNTTPRGGQLPGVGYGVGYISSGFSAYHGMVLNFEVPPEYRTFIGPIRGVIRVDSFGGSNLYAADSRGVEVQLQNSVHALGS